MDAGRIFAVDNVQGRLDLAAQAAKKAGVLSIVHPSFMITDTMPLDKAPEAFREFDQRQGQHMKVVLETPASAQMAG